MQRNDLPVLARLVQSAGTRLRINDALRALARGLPVVLIVACLALAAGKLSLLPVQAGTISYGLVIIASAALLIAVGRAALRAAPWQRGALEIDRHYALQDRLTSALEFQERPPTERSVLMEACIEQAAVMAQNLDARKAVPLRVPSDSVYSVVLVSVALLIHLYPVSTPTQRAVTPVAQQTAFVAEADDLALMRELADEWQHTTRSPQGREVAQRFNQLVMDIAAGKVDRHQVLERLQALQQSLSPLDAEQQAALNEGLEGLAR
ncbi:MAG TPA: hypothetical protein VHO25_03850, partial [Polyangiaceae bacterium]|nr:hypothetical protein [Polyangiaceae bacterium]